MSILSKDLFVLSNKKALKATVLLHELEKTGRIANRNYCLSDQFLDSDMKIYEVRMQALFPPIPSPSPHPWGSLVAGYHDCNCNDLLLQVK